MKLNKPDGEEGFWPSLRAIPGAGALAIAGSVVAALVSAVLYIESIRSDVEVLKLRAVAIDQVSREADERQDKEHAAALVAFSEQLNRVESKMDRLLLRDAVRSTAKENR